MKKQKSKNLVGVKFHSYSQAATKTVQAQSPIQWVESILEVNTWGCDTVNIQNNQNKNSSLRIMRSKCEKQLCVLN